MLSTMLWERVVVTAKEFLAVNNINHCKEFTEPLYQSKIILSGWEMQFAASSIFAEIVWQIAIGRETITDRQRLDRLFSPSPVATHANFRGCREYKTGNLPEKGAIAVWVRGNSWQGDMAIVTNVSEDNKTFDVIQGRILCGSDTKYIQVEEFLRKPSRMPFSSEKLNLKGFIYPPNREIA